MSSRARERADKGMQFEEFTECGICLGTCFKLHIYKKFQMDVSRKQRCVVFPSPRSFPVRPVLVWYHTHRAQINTRAKTVARPMLNESFSC